MKHRNVTLLSLGLVLALVHLTRAQNDIPNAGFETWSAGDPADWTTSNETVPGTVTQSADAYAGSWAARGDVIEPIPGVSFPPFLYSKDLQAFPVSQRWGSIGGFYKLNAVGGDALQVVVSMFKNQVGIGQVYYVDSVGTSTYKEFTAPVEYFTEDTPDSAVLYINLLTTGLNEMVHVGSYFIIDALSFSVDSSGGGTCPIAATGDVNLTGDINSTDIIYIVNYVLKAGPLPMPCEAAADVNCSSTVNLTDVTYLVNYVLKGGPPPCDVCTMIPGTWSCP